MQGRISVIVRPCCSYSDIDINARNNGLDKTPTSAHRPARMATKRHLHLRVAGSRTRRRWVWGQFRAADWYCTVLSGATGGFPTLTPYIGYAPEHAAAGDGPGRRTSHRGATPIKLPLCRPFNSSYPSGPASRQVLFTTLASLYLFRVALLPQHKSAILYFRSPRESSHVPGKKSHPGRLPF